ncbi:MAG: hypothetical protein J6W11_06270 [Alphaproteobacteria bacterium]|nr:hypothetical protein [Alphaproteobacteria bacterium]MBO7098221.1 hypothetical protein [Alphaproteobacteria bacterium]
MTNLISEKAFNRFEKRRAGLNMNMLTAKVAASRLAGKVQETKNEEVQDKTAVIER